ncbi:ANTAR domain-containing protein [Lapillicoccus jejuensis]|uniref:ANTAR domain-containing protein n=1 Tax=Lapillicoccus jejuensis TaxID=402171 RepID=UPI00114EFA7D|nr:ANTAR domain-containing protein [Lapillicoccus jejuensis]
MSDGAHSPRDDSPATEVVLRRQVEQLTRRVEQLTTQVGNLRLALDSNRQIGMAVGILMALRGATESDAFDDLVQVSRTTNRKVREVAADVVQTGELPPADPHPGNSSGR